MDKNIIANMKLATAIQQIGELAREYHHKWAYGHDEEKKKYWSMYIATVQAMSICSDLLEKDIEDIEDDR